MIFQFDGDVAEKYGVDEATFLAYVYFWTKTNKANEVNFYDGRYWTYNTQKAFVELFPFWSRRTIQRILKNCEEAGLLLVGNYNAKTTDQTRWYALSDDAIHAHFPLHQIVHSNAPNSAMQCTEPCNVYNEHLTTQLEAESNKLRYTEIMDEFNRRCKRLRPCSRLTDKRRRVIKTLFSKKFDYEQLYLAFDKANASDFCTGNNKRGWTADFDWLLKEENLVKVLEGKYSDDAAKVAPPKGGFDEWD